MNNHASGPSFDPDFSYLRDLREIFLSSTGSSGSQRRGFGYSVQVRDSNDSGYLAHQLTSQGTPGSSHTLDDSSILYLPSVEKTLMSPDFFSQNDTEEFMLGCFAYKTDEDISFTGLTSTDSQQTDQPSLRSVAMVEPLNKDTQQQVLTETVKTKKENASFGSGEPSPLTPRETFVSRMRKASRATIQAKYHATCEAKSRRAISQSRYNTSEKGRNTKARYRKSDKGREGRAKYNESEKGKWKTAKRNSRYHSSEKGKNTTAKYYASDRGMIARIVANTKSYAYRSALKLGLSEELAREKAESAANKKRAELSGLLPSCRKASPARSGPIRRAVSASPSP